MQPLLMTELVCALAWALTGIGLALIVALVVGVAVVDQRILEFIEYFNRTMAKPFKWTYKGRPLKV